MKLESALKRLAEGAFVCGVSYPDEYDALKTEQGQREADEWLGKIGYRLARLSDDGAFFMAHAVATLELRVGLRDEMRSVREQLDPIVGFLEVLRQAQGRDPHIHPGDMLWESEIYEAVRSQSLLERRLNDMRDIGGRLTEGAFDRVRRVLERLEKEGYLVQAHAAMKGYQVTGKILYLYQLLALIAENTPLLSDDSVVDTIDPQTRLDATEEAEPKPLGADGASPTDEASPPAQDGSGTPEPGP